MTAQEQIERLNRELRRGMITECEHMVLVIDVCASENADFSLVTENVSLNLLISYLAFEEE